MHIKRNNEYFKFNDINHKANCKICNDYILQPHAVKPNESNTNKYCIACGWIMENENGPAFGELLSNSNRLITENESYILDNGIIVLVDEDIEKYINGTLVFFEENKDTDIS